MNKMAVLLLALCFAFQFGYATPGEPGIQTINNGALQFSFAIPDQWSTQLIREESDHAINFKFKKSDGTTIFLFSVNKVSETTWMSIKDQLENFKMVDHKNSNIYYTTFTSKRSIKGTDNDVYTQIYDHLAEILASIKITE